MSARTPLAAQRAQRAALALALAERVTQTEWRVLAALLHECTAFDRTEDRVNMARLAELTGVDERHIRRATKRLAELSIIEREPGRRGLSTLYRFPATGADEGAEDARADVAHPSELGGQVSTVRGADVDATPGAYAPHPEVFSEASSDVVLSRAEMITTGKRLVRDFYNKVPGVITDTVADMGAEAVSAALRDLNAAGERFPGQIGLEKAIRNHANPTPARSTVPYHRPICNTCTGSGMTYDDDANAARRCPECNTLKVAG